MKVLFTAIISFCCGCYVTASYLNKPFVEKKQSEAKESIIKFLTTVD